MPDYFNQHSISADAPAATTGWSLAEGVQSIDLDGDGDLDLIVAYTGPTETVNGEVVGPETPIQILLNDGTGHFTDATSAYFPSGAPLTQITHMSYLGDFNGDGKLDVYMPDHGPEDVFPGGPGTLLLSSGSTYIDGVSFLTGSNYVTHDVAVGDLDGDGDDDFVEFAAGGPFHPEVVFSAPTGFSVSANSFPFVTWDLFTPGNPYGQPSSITGLLFDADGDHDLDMVMGTTHPGGLANPSLILFNDGTGHFYYGANDTSPLPFMDPGNFDVIVDSGMADFDGDGDIDFVFSGVGSEGYGGPLMIGIYANDGAGHFTLTKLDLGGRLGSALLNVCDVNGDGYMDIVADSDSRLFLLNDGTGHFVPLPDDITDVPYELVRFTATDLNGDGRTDFLGFSGSLGGLTSFIAQDQGPVQTGDENANGLMGDGDSETLNGLGGNDVIFAGAGNDLLNGGLGGDTMVGGQGNDTYFVDSLTDLVIENAGGGIDVALISVSGYTLGANVEVAAIQGVGLTITGNALSNILYGASGADTLNGRDGDDTLQGGANSDTLVGGLGNDTFYVAQPGDIVVENSGEGFDATIVQMAAAYTLAANVEIGATFLGLGVNITGNGLDNLLYGNAGADTLNGAGGNDTIQGGSGNDTMIGGLGNDTYFFEDAGDVITENLGEGTDAVIVFTSSYTLAANVEVGARFLTTAYTLTGNSLANQLYGNNGDDTLNGGDGNDTIQGGGGNDTMVGGLGNDTYLVEQASDVVTENSGEGSDAVIVLIGSYTLAANVEVGATFLTSGVSITGNGLDNRLYGNSGADTLNGGAGADLLEGGAGADTLTGGSENDTFTFVAGQGNGDTITDFAGNGGAAGDVLRFNGYGTTAGGATFVQLDATHWQINSADGTIHDTITLSNGASVDASDWLFV